MQWVSLERKGDEQLADDLTSELRQKLSHFPQFNRAETRGITLFKRSGQVWNTFIRFCSIETLLTFFCSSWQGHFHLSCHSVVEQSKAGPKGPVNQFNFFSIEARKLLREQNKEKEVTFLVDLFSLPLMRANAGGLLFPFHENRFRIMIGIKWLASDGEKCLLKNTLHSNSKLSKIKSATKRYARLSSINRLIPILYYSNRTLIAFLFTLQGMRGSWYFIRQARAPHCLQSFRPPGLQTF
jgi:hypothetical protein